MRTTITKKQEKISIEEYHSKLCKLIYSIYGGSCYGLEIQMQFGTLKYVDILGNKICVRYTSEPWDKDYEYKQFVTLIVSKKMDDLEPFEFIVANTSPYDRYPKPFIIKLPEPRKFLQKIIGYSSVEELHISTNKKGLVMTNSH